MKNRIYRPEAALDRAEMLSRAHQFHDERWEPILFFPGYLVSNYGRVYSWRNDGILNGSIDPSGRIRVSMMKMGRLKDTVQTRYVHHLVATAFVEDPYEGSDIERFVEFIDGDPYNLMADNLKWVSPEERKRVSGARQRRVRVVETGQIFDSKSECARHFRISSATVSRLVKGVGTIQGLTLELVE